ncbi:CENPB DNA-binding domain-containing protein 1 [Portunus trituberculatus]|uniref:CENPB DNA-binding domain-containing protein 1 n=1 Tax=Portunus trituberculatus TaxID=210409 RepID=A0A5B7F847_PORTR|nr:CENPB DNA-binding domain-containing protein 1 [Portunus trituberculatus]
MTYSEAPQNVLQTLLELKRQSKRGGLTLEVKLYILKRKEQGESMSGVSCNLGLAQLTVWTVLKNREAIKKTGENATDLQSKLLTKHHEPIMDKMDRSSKVAHDIEKSVKIYEIYDKKIRNTKQSSIYSFIKPVRHATPVTPANPATAGPSTSAADGSIAGPSSISSFFKPVKHADPATAGPSTSASDSADHNMFEGFEPPAVRFSGTHMYRIMRTYCRMETGRKWSAVRTHAIE